MDDMIGVHLIIDGVFKQKVDGDVVMGILRELPGKIDMNILEGPVVVEGVPENPGWTGFVIIDKSHIAIHTFDALEGEKGGDKVSIDVFSCKHFDEHKVLDYFKDKFEFKHFKHHYLKRKVK
jgi:S-adenosylmethionine/arginine decarboxylase-like enzyme